MNKFDSLVQKYRKNCQNGVPKSTQNQDNSSLDLTGSSHVTSNVSGSSQHHPRMVPGSSQGPPGRQSRSTKHAKWHPWAPKSTKKSVKIQAWNPGTQSVLFAVFSIAPKSAQGPPGRQSEATNHAKWQVRVPRMPRAACNNAKNLQSQSNEQWSGAGGRGRSP